MIHQKKFEALLNYNDKLIVRRAFKIPTVRDEDFFTKKVECYAHSLKDWEFMRYHIVSMEVHQTFCLPCITGRPMDNFVKVNMN